MLVRNQHQSVGSHSPVTEKSVQLRSCANRGGVDDLQHPVANTQRTQALLTTKPLVLQGLQFFDQSGFKQQGAYFPCGLLVLDSLRLAQHSGFFGRAQVGKQSAANIDAFADIKRYRIAFSVKEIDPWRPGSSFDLSTQVRWVFINKVWASRGGGHTGNLRGGSVWLLARSSIFRHLSDWLVSTPRGLPVYAT